MVTELHKMLPGFPGQAARTRCFCHIVNLVAKSVISQFDIPKNAKVALATEADMGDPGDSLDEVIDHDLAALAEELEIEEGEAQIEENKQGNEGDNDDGWVDERAEMSRAERAILNQDVMPARRVLGKVGPC